MSNTIVDFPKVTQMLDAGWEVRIYKGAMRTYEVRAIHEKDRIMVKVRDNLEKEMLEKGKKFLKETGFSAEEAVELMHFHDGELMTDDFTPEQALSRMAYKVLGEVLL